MAFKINCCDTCGTTHLILVRSSNSFLYLLLKFIEKIFVHSAHSQNRQSHNQRGGSPKGWSSPVHNYAPLPQKRVKTFFWKHSTILPLKKAGIVLASFLSWSIIWWGPRHVINQVYQREIQPVIAQEPLDPQRAYNIGGPLLLIYQCLFFNFKLILQLFENQMDFAPP